VAGRAESTLTLASQFLNVWLFNGSPDETVSGRSYRQGVLLADPVWARRRVLIDRLFFLAPDHCRRSHEADVEFAREVLRSEHT
jgi:hypothetical protein